MYSSEDIGCEGFEGSISYEIEYALNRKMQGQQIDGIKIIDSIDSKDATCVLFDIDTKNEGTKRIGYYSDNANTVVDDCKGTNSIVEWANDWDTDSLLPLYISQFGY